MSRRMIALVTLLALSMANPVLAGSPFGGLKKQLQSAQRSTAHFNQSNLMQSAKKSVNFQPSVKMPSAKFGSSFNSLKGKVNSNLNPRTHSPIINKNLGPLVPANKTLPWTGKPIITPPKTPLPWTGKPIFTPHKPLPWTGKPIFTPKPGPIVCPVPNPIPCPLPTPLPCPNPSPIPCPIPYPYPVPCPTTGPCHTPVVVYPVQPVYETPCQPVVSPVEDANLVEIHEGQQYKMALANLGSTAGQVTIYLGPIAAAANVISWGADEVVFEAPVVGLTEAAPATLVVWGFDGTKLGEVAIQFAPQLQETLPLPPSGS